MARENGLTRPALKPWLRVASDDAGTIVEFGQRFVTFDGAAARSLLPALLPLLDGTRTLDEIVGVLGEPIGEAVENAVAILKRHDLLTEGPSVTGLLDPVGSTAAFLAATSPRGQRAQDAASSIAGRPIAIAGSSRLSREVTRLLGLAGFESIRLIDEPSSYREVAALVVVAPSADEPLLLGKWNRQALHLGCEWLQVLSYDGRYAAIGPLYLPGDTCCYECFERRRGASLRVGIDRRTALESVPGVDRASPAMDAAAAGLAVTVALRWVAERDALVPGVLHALEYGSSLTGAVEVTTHFVHRVPRCTSCSDVESLAPPLPWFKEAARASA